MNEHISTNGEEAEIHLRDYLRVIVKHRLLFIAVFIGVLIAAGAYTLIQKNVYEAVLKFEVLSGAHEELPSRFYSGGGKKDILTSIEKLKGGELYREVALNMGLCCTVLEKPEHVFLESLTASYIWNGAGPPFKEYTLDFSGGVCTVFDTDGKELFSFASGETVTSGPLELTVRFSGEGEDRVRIRAEYVNYTMQRLREAVSVSQMGDTNIIRIAVQTDSQEKAASIANEIFRVYISKDVAHQKRRLSKALLFAGDKRGHYKEELEKAREQEKRLMREEGIYSSVDKQSGIVANRLYSIEHRLEDTLISLAETEKGLIFAREKRDHYREKLAAARNREVAFKEKENIYSIGQQSTVLAQELSRALSEKAYAQINIEKIKKGFLPDSYRFIDMVHGRNDLAGEFESTIQYADSKIEECEKKLSALPRVQRSLVECTRDISFYNSLYNHFDRQYISLEEKKETLTNSHKSLKVKAEQYRKKIGKYPALKKNMREVAYCIAFNNRMYSMFAEKCEELRGKIDATLENAVMVEAPLDKGGPVKPNRAVNAALGLIMGLVLASGSVFLLEYFDNTFSSIEEVEQETGEKILSVIPYINRRKLERNGNGVAYIDSHSRAAESFKMLNTAVEFPTPGKNGHARSVVISSSSSKEGKSTVATNLAITAANFGVKTVLLDADLKKSVQHTVFSIPREPGFSGMLQGRSSVDEGVHECGITNLSVIPGGHVLKHTDHMITGERIAPLLMELEKTYDFIVIDSPPVLHIDDSIRIGRFTEGMIYVVSLGNTDRLMVKRGISLVRARHLPLLGICVNDRAKSDGYYFSYDAYFEQYKKSSESDPRLTPAAHPGQWRILI